ncbi:MAG: heat-inducible transcriptional repressor HrcA [Dehalococcoidia bacterium]
MLTSRQEAILNVLVAEYITSAVPVASQSIVRSSGLGLSPATVRGEMAELEDAGFIHRPHISSGGIPSDKGYRHYVATIPHEPLLSEVESAEVRIRLQQATEDVELWANMTAELLADLVRNLAVVTAPKASQSRIKRLDLVLLQETLALLVLVFQQARTKQRILRLATTVTQEDLTTLANRLSAAYGGATYHGVTALEAYSTPLERQVVDATKDMMLDEDRGQFEEPCVVGLRHLLSQPEFAERAKASVLVDMLEDRKFLRDALQRLLAGERVNVVIGEENDAGEMQGFSVVVSRYGQRDKVSGIVAAIGPTRMEYERAIASVGLLSATMTELVWDLS